MHDPAAAGDELSRENALLKQKIQELELAAKEHRHTLEALHHSEIKLRTLYDSTSDAVLLVEEAGFLDCNRAALEIYGCATREEFFSTNPAELSPPAQPCGTDSLSLSRQNMAAAFARGSLQFEWIHKRADTGETFPADILLTALALDGKPVLLAAVRDISKRKQAEKALRESEAKYRRITENTGDIVAEIDAGGIIRYVSPAHERILGDPASSVLSRSLYDRVHPDDRARIVAQNREGVTTKTEREVEYRYRHAAGHYIWLRSVSRPLYDEAGEFQTWIVNSSDITGRKTAEEALKREEEKYRTLISNIRDGVLIIQDARIQFINEAFTRITGYTLAEISRLHIRDVAVPEDADTVAGIYARRLAGGDVVSDYEFRLRHADRKTTLTVSIHACIIDYRGRPATMGMLQDVTYRRQAEREKQRLEERLQHAEKMEAIGTLAGGIAHDFNNLLMGIQGQTALARLNLNKNDATCEKLRRIEEQVRSGADLTGQLLAFARGGRYEVKPVNINDIIEKATDLYGRTKKEIVISCRLAENLWSAEVDQGQIEQVLLNLYVNAWQAMPGGGSIHLETENIVLCGKQAVDCEITAGRYVKITVTDTGSGMDDKTRERIFDPFFTTKAMGRGTGLGLATVYGIIKGHKGAINVYSKPGHGTTFSIYLPASQKEAVKEKPETWETSSGAGTVLLIDDEPMVLEVNAEMLRTMGYKVFTAASGQEGLAVYQLEGAAIDLVILDMIMPGLSGGDTFNRLRAVNPAVKVLLSSGYSLNGEAQTIMDRGCRGFLQKPFQMGKLSRKISEILG